MSSLSIYHNPRCSKSRQTLQLLNDNGHSPSIIEYLKTPLTTEMIKDVLTKLSFDDARQLMRKKEPEYKALELSNETLTQEALIHALVENPRLIERPIVINGNLARIGRPPESVLDII
jgi:arsenate reductase